MIRATDPRKGALNPVQPRTDWRAAFTDDRRSPALDLATDAATRSVSRAADRLILDAADRLGVNPEDLAGMVDIEVTSGEVQTSPDGATHLTHALTLRPKETP